MKRIGIMAQGFADWGGGLDFLGLTVRSLRIAKPEVELHVLVPTHGAFAQLLNLRNWALRKLGNRSVDDRPDSSHFECAFAETGVHIHRIGLGSYALATACRRLGLEGLIPAINPLPLTGLPWVGYIADLQHKRLPQFFTERECAKRDQSFLKMLTFADAVIVNAKDVVNDIDLYFPNRRARVFSMPFSPAPAHDAFSVVPEDAARRYQVRGHYFIICNQFWKHKDHATAFKAFAAIANRHSDLSLVCTGATSDYRFPGYFDELMREAQSFGVADRILVLGLIPKLDQLALLRGAVALIQPTLFEGGPGGGSVFDSIAMGKRSIISDISVNMEIFEHTVTYFTAGDADDLAAAMELAMATCELKDVLTDSSELIRAGLERRRACGEFLLEALDYVTKVRHARNCNRNDE